MLTAELTLDVLTAFEALIQHTDYFCQLIMKETHLTAWTDKSEALPHNYADHRMSACEAFRQYEYLDHQEPREIMITAGFLGASEKTVEQAVVLNQKKEAFKTAMLALKSGKGSLKEQSLIQRIQSILSQRPGVTALALNRLGLSRLHLKQCYRLIPILSEIPSKITWTWAHTRSIKKISFFEAEQMLLQKGQGQHIELQLKKLHTLSTKESLAIVQDLAPHLRSNIVFKSSLGTKRMMIKGPLPILYPATEKTPCPSFKPPKEKCDKDQNRVIRKDNKIESEPFLTAIRAHRYIQ